MLHAGCTGAVKNAQEPNDTLVIRGTRRMETTYRDNDNLLIQENKESCTI